MTTAQHPAQPSSLLASHINSVQTSIPLVNTAGFCPTGGVANIGDRKVGSLASAQPPSQYPPLQGALVPTDSSDFETIEYAGISGNTLVGVSRGGFGSTAQIFPMGTGIKGQNSYYVEEPAVQVESPPEVSLKDWLKVYG